MRCVLYRGIADVFNPSARVGSSRRDYARQSVAEERRSGRQVDETLVVPAFLPFLNSGYGLRLRERKYSSTRVRYSEGT